MASYFDEHTQRLVINNQEHSIESDPLPDRFRVIFNFSGLRTRRYEILRENSTELQYDGGSTSPLHIKSIEFGLETIKSTKQKRMYNVLKKGLIGYRISVRIREELAKHAAKTAWDILVSSMSPPNNLLNLHIHFCEAHKHVRYHGANRVIQQRVMIPTSKASIESLKCKIIDSSDGNCSICLEDLKVGCEGVCMPCSHLFHRGCIRRWLRTSHYCPVCRFQMPTIF